MNTNHIKTYAPKARSAFIAAMTKQASKYGISAKGSEQLEQKGDLALIGDRPFPASIIRPRAALMKKVEQLGFAQAMEQAAYSWFNRLCAIRFMELKGYLDHGLRVLSHPSQTGGFQILDDCLNIELPGLDKQRITALKLDGNQDEALYRELLLAQCHALHQAMPFLFEAIDDQTELLLPDNLTKTDSLIRALVDAIPEADWQDVEIIGWLYQFYISEKKDQVIGKVVKSEDIPAATQLFTPNWIVKYMVQNSLGAQWLATYPDSLLKAQMEYYIEPAEQTDEVNAQLAAITPSALNPEELTLIDPASGSGHILVEAYDLFKAIYLERGYRQRDIPQLILEKNLFGLDIDGRAAQLSGFALMMKGREDDRRLFERGVKLNVMALVDSTDFDAEAVINGVNLGQYGLQAGDITELKRLFEHATTFGSLIQVPEGLANKLSGLKHLSEASSQDLFVAEAVMSLGLIVKQTELLAAQYDAVVANPPYMGTGGMNDLLKSYIRFEYRDFAADLCTAFIARAFNWLPPGGMSAQVNLQKWMFQSSFSEMRGELLRRHNIESLIQIGFNSFPSMNSKIALGCASVIRRELIPGFLGHYVDLNSAPKSADKAAVFRERDARLDHAVCQSTFLRIPDSPIAYWGRYDVVFGGTALEEEMQSGGRCKTHADDLYVRFHWEVSNQGIHQNGKWRFYEKGGDFRKWYGNRLFIVNWSKPARNAYASNGGLTQERFWNRIGITWSDIALQSGFRLKLDDTEYSSVSPTIFPKDSNDPDLRLLLLLNSSLVKWLMRALNPGLHANPGDVLKIPQVLLGESATAKRAVELAKVDWDSFEVSREFLTSPLVRFSGNIAILCDCAEALMNEQSDAISELKTIEEVNNANYINHFGLSGEVPADVPLPEVSLTCNPAYRYGGKMTKDELWTRFREDTCAELVSYAIGCMMGRYSLDEPGLIYAHSGNDGFDPSRYATFPADDDGIIPLTDKEWFTDDTANRLVEFITLAWDKTYLEANLRFLADNLSPKKGEGSRDTLRRYLCDSFFKDHLQTYKKRPIYWLFSSGKQKAFQCLVYLHRYNASTLSRMRTLHVIPLSAKLNSYANKLEQDIDASTSTAEKKALEKQLSTLHNQQAELATFDEKLRHCADQRINLDLDDGVKVNYSKFGDLLAEVKTVTGDKAE